MKTAFILLLLSGATHVFAQSDTIPPYKKNPVIPSFSLLTVDSATISDKDLKDSMKTVILFFSPGCEYCQHEVQGIISHIDKFSDIQIVMATYAPLSELKMFMNDYHLVNQPNILVGRDSKYFFLPFFKATGIPFMALYNEKKQLVTSFDSSIPVGELLAAFTR